MACTHKHIHTQTYKCKHTRTVLHNTRSATFTNDARSFVFALKIEKKASLLRVCVQVPLMPAYAFSTDRGSMRLLSVHCVREERLVITGVGVMICVILLLTSACVIVVIQHKKVCLLASNVHSFVD